MRSVLYGLLGLVIGAVFCITLLTSVPQGVTRTATSISNQEQNTNVPEQVPNDYTTTQNFATYHVNRDSVEKYKSAKVIEYGRINPMLYYIATPVAEEPVDGETPIDDGEKPNIPDVDNQIEDPEDIINDDTDEVDADMDTSVVEFDWKGYESSYVLPRGYLFGYNTKTKKLNVVDVATLEGDIIFNGKFPIDKEFYYTSSSFGIRQNPFDKSQKEFHKGLDISADKVEGANVYAILDGTITQTSDNEGYGNYVVIDHGKYSTIYAHLGSFAENLETGDKVKAGDVIGYVGSTGRSTGPHLHIEFDINGVKVTPKHFMNLMLARK